MYGSIVYGHSMALKIACSNPRLNSGLVRIGEFCALNESTDNSKDFYQVVFRELC